ncbi:Two-component, sigma54 specific, transcriptional regulator, Fis family [Desulfatibacillum aliphaticivorans]|uniref:Two-component, sigma54 specific, transcriptional regulator, Fis family n=1 Tax=Desulfatibacillum aliphaticivorans TaxID=218208 RepID=B8FFG3_DESAL|nr:sigma-54 dependent transcriptional regulator [Desulfatibacillum aliphaticivorans]ACL04223.1 Two-component, sigma54 specific, transcriptional regulator, Fis family [Desulfatibacillum aliphaticivorans]
MKRRLLIVDDEPDMLHLLKRSLEPDLNCVVETAASGLEAMEILGQERFDLILADIKMPKMDGLELLEKVQAQYPDQTMVMMTGHGSIDVAVQAIQKGAYDFVTKPFDHEALVVRLEKALERSKLIAENRRLVRWCGQQRAFENMVGQSPAMQTVFDTIKTVSQTDMTVLITGESGTGKELAARAIHSLSPRSSGPFVAINCPTVPENILESELFGYKKGAFTHASTSRQGLFEEANGGTLFLDEIGDVTPSIQTKLLRVLQEKEIKPLGSNKSRKVNVRIVASTNQDLQKRIDEGLFREDFYYRLAVVPVVMPPLRERNGDVPLIAAHLAAKHCKDLGKLPVTLSPNFVNWLENQTWTGNVRELENTIIQAILFSEGGTLEPPKTAPAATQTLSRISVPDLSAQSYKEAKESILEAFHRNYLGALLKETGGNVTQAAKNCGMERQNLQQILRRYNISAQDFRD